MRPFYNHISAATVSWEVCRINLSLNPSPDLRKQIVYTTHLSVINRSWPKKCAQPCEGLSLSHTQQKSIFRWAHFLTQPALLRLPLICAVKYNFQERFSCILGLPKGNPIIGKIKNAIVKICLPTRPTSTEVTSNTCSNAGTQSMHLFADSLFHLYNPYTTKSRL